MTDSADKLTYPLLYLSQRAGIGVADSPEHLLRVSSALVFRAHLFEGLRLASVTGDEFQVEHAEVERPRSEVGVWWARLFHLPVQMRVRVRLTDPTPLAELKARVLAQMTRESEELEETTRHSLAWWRDRIDPVTSTSELVRAFADGVAAG